MNNARVMKLGVTHSVVSDKRQLQQDFYCERVFAFESLVFICAWTDYWEKKSEWGILYRHACQQHKGEKAEETTEVTECWNNNFSLQLSNILYRPLTVWGLNACVSCLYTHGCVPTTLCESRSSGNLQVVASSANMRRPADQEVDQREVNRWNFT